MCLKRWFFMKAVIKKSENFKLWISESSAYSGRFWRSWQHNRIISCNKFNKLYFCTISCSNAASNLAIDTVSKCFIILCWSSGSASILIKILVFFWRIRETHWRVIGRSNLEAKSKAILGWLISGFSSLFFYNPVLFFHFQTYSLSGTFWFSPEIFVSLFFWQFFKNVNAKSDSL